MSGKERRFNSALSVFGYPENIRIETCFPHYLHNSLHLPSISYHIIQTALACEYSCTWDREVRKVVSIDGNGQWIWNNEEDSEGNRLMISSEMIICMGV